MPWRLFNGAEVNEGLGAWRGEGAPQVCVHLSCVVYVIRVILFCFPKSCGMRVYVQVQRWCVRGVVGKWQSSKGIAVTFFVTFSNPYIS